MSNKIHSYRQLIVWQKAIEISKKLSKTKNLNYNKIEGSLEEIMKMLNVMIIKLKANS